MSLGKLKLPVPYEDFFPGLLIANGLQEMTPDFRHYREYSRCRFIIAVL